MTTVNVEKAYRGWWIYTDQFHARIEPQGVGGWLFVGHSLELRYMWVVAGSALKHKQISHKRSQRFYLYWVDGWRV